MVVVLTEVSAGRPPPLTEPERNAMASLPTVTNSRTAWKGSPSDGNCSISFRTRQGQTASGGGSVLPPARNLRTAFSLGGFSRCVPGANRCVPRCVSVRSLKRIDVFLGADWCGYWGGIIIDPIRKSRLSRISVIAIKNFQEIFFVKMSGIQLWR